jgi:hypothetical protein
MRFGSKPRTAAKGETTGYARAFGVPWTTVQEEHNRIVVMVTFDRDPLVDASDAGKHFFLNRLRRTNV